MGNGPLCYALVMIKGRISYLGLLAVKGLIPGCFIFDLTCKRIVHTYVAELRASRCRSVNPAAGCSGDDRVSPTLV